MRHSGDCEPWRVGLAALIAALMAPEAATEDR
jgi:hypothetical protein